jgi:hypothetical protein
MNKSDETAKDLSMWLRITLLFKTLTSLPHRTLLACDTAGHIEFRREHTHWLFPKMTQALLARFIQSCESSAAVTAT